MKRSLYIAPPGAMQFEVEQTLKASPEAIGARLWVQKSTPQKSPRYRMPNCNCTEFFVVIKTFNRAFRSCENRSTVCRCMGKFVE